MKETMTTTGWQSITDVPCPRGCGGTIQWAEAGRVPGYRVCNCCDAHFVGDPATGTLKRQPGKVKRVTKGRMKQTEAASRARIAGIQRSVIDVYGASIAKADMRGTDKGGPVGACLDIGAVMRAIAEFERVGLSDHPIPAEARSRFAAELAAARSIAEQVSRNGTALSVEAITNDAALLYSPIGSSPGWVWRDRPTVRLSRSEMDARGIWR